MLLKDVDDFYYLKFTTDEKIKEKKKSLSYELFSPRKKVQRVVAYSRELLSCSNPRFMS
jgi:hypothetical protein